MSDVKENVKKQIPTSQKIINIVMIVVCVLLVFILLMNCILIISDMLNPNGVPRIFKRTPLIVLTESMEPDIKAGDLIICKSIEATDVKIGDVISYFDPEGDGSTIITHKVYDIEIDDKTGNRFFRTYGINNNAKDFMPVPEENLVGIWNGARFWQLGRILLFVQSIPGILICVILPFGAFIAYEIIRRKKQDAAKQDDIDKLKAELEAMKAAQQTTSEDAKEPETKDTAESENNG
ncbi:MAG: signal peptidase I [Clostridia bacterium]|nr:signal peptidase I [Clostridia bacterium]